MAYKNGAKILLLGCGQVGSRHLQALASLPRVHEIEVVDSRPEALELGRERLAELSHRSPSAVIHWLSSLKEARQGGDLCIVATQAEGRPALVREVAQRLDYSSFILEKIVAQSIEEMEDLVGFCTSKNLSAWVNCKARAYPVHQQFKSLLDPADPIVFHAVGGNHGLANNGIHMADLFTFYDEAKQIDSAGSSADPLLHFSKRGSQLFDLSGTLHGMTAKGSHFILTYAKDHVGPELITMTTKHRRFIIDHMSRWAMESQESTGWSWKPVPFEGDYRVSGMTGKFVIDILAQKRCAIPTLEESLVAHRFILSELQPFFRQLLKQEMELCPVT